MEEKLKRKKIGREKKKKKKGGRGGVLTHPTY